MTAKNAADLTGAMDDTALGATKGGIDVTPLDAQRIEELSSSIRKRILKNAGRGYETILGESAGTTPTSPSSESPSSGLTRQWRKPRDAKGFASQANEVATMILNGEMDLDRARVYSGVARTMAQVLSAEVYRARYLQQAPDLTFDEET